MKWQRPGVMCTAKSQGKTTRLKKWRQINDPETKDETAKWGSLLCHYFLDSSQIHQTDPGPWGLCVHPDRVNMSLIHGVGPFSKSFHSFFKSRDTISSKQPSPHSKNQLWLPFRALRPGDKGQVSFYTGGKGRKVLSWSTHFGIKLSIQELAGQTWVPGRVKECSMMVTETSKERWDLLLLPVTRLPFSHALQLIHRTETHSHLCKIA